MAFTVSYTLAEGPEGLANLASDFGDQVHPAVAALRNGGHALAYAHATSPREISTVFRDAAGVRTGDESLALNSNYTVLGGPAVAQLADDNVIVAFTSNDSDAPGVYAFRFLEDGGRITLLLTLLGGAPAGVDYLSAPSVSAREGGGFALAVAVDGGGPASARLALYSNGGVQQAQTVTSGAHGAVSAASVAALSDGGFAVAMQDETFGVFSTVVQTFDDDLRPRGAATAFADSTLATGTQPVVVALADGRFVVASVSSFVPGMIGAGAIWLQTFEADGSLILQPDGAAGIMVSVASGARAMIDPKMIDLGDGLLALSWTRVWSATDLDVQTRLVRWTEEDGLSTVSSVLAVASSADDESEADIALLGSGGLLHVYRDDVTDGSGGRITSEVATLSGVQQGDDAGDTFPGMRFIDEIRAGGGPDVLIDTAGTDRLFGEGGDDTVVLRDGAAKPADVFDGGADADTLLVAGASIAADLRPMTELRDFERIAFEAVGGAKSQAILLDASQLTAVNGMDAIAVVGGGGGSVGAAEAILITMDTGSLDLSEWTFEGWGGATQTLRVTGTNAVELVYDSAAADFIQTLGGDDAISLSSGGADVVDAGAGYDTVFYRGDGLADAAGLFISGGLDLGTFYVMAADGTVPTLFDFTAGTVRDFERLVLDRSMPGDASMEVRIDGFTDRFDSVQFSNGPDRVVLEATLAADYDFAHMNLFALEAEDVFVIRHGAQDFALAGTHERDVIFSGGGVDVIDGNGGADVIVVEGGSATVAGNDGADLFRPEDAAVLLEVADFADGEDRLDLRAFHIDAATASVAGATLDAGTVLLQVDGAAGMTEIRLAGIALADFSADDVLFATAPMLGSGFSASMQEDAGPAAATVTLIGDDPFATPVLAAGVRTFSYGVLTTTADSWSFAPAPGFGDSIAAGAEARFLTPLTTTLGFELKVALVISGVNDAPTARQDFLTTDEDSAIAFDPRFNDSDVDGDALAVTHLDGAQATVGVAMEVGLWGSVATLRPDGSILYAPGDEVDRLALGERAVDTFSYRVSDGNGGEAEADVTVRLNGLNDAPVAADDHFGRPGIDLADVSTDEETPIRSISALANDVDPDDGAVLTVTHVNGAPIALDETIHVNGGLLTLRAGGTFDYDPVGFTDFATQGVEYGVNFTYTVSDGLGGSDTGLFAFIVSGVNDAPIAVDDDGAGFETDEDTAFETASVLDNDSDPDAGETPAVTAVDGAAATVGAAIALASGALVTPRADGSFRYDPNGAFAALAAGAVATDAFDYEIADPHGASDAARVTVSILGVNDAPSAADDAGGAAEDSSTSGDVLANDSDPDGDALSVISVGGAPEGVGAEVAGRYGTLTLGADGAFLYRADRADGLIRGQVRSDGFDYAIGDGAGGEDSATLTFRVEGRDEVLRGTSRADALSGGGGDDRLFGLNGHDVLRGRAGNDRLEGGRGHDALHGQNGHDRLRGGDGNDKLFGGRGRDELYGQKGRDELRGGDHADRLFGQNGDDLLRGEAGNDRLDGGRGRDALFGQNGNDLLRGGAGHDRLDGGRGRDDLQGQNGHDLLRGGGGADRLDGGRGRDELYGQRGADDLRGGGGNDIFHFRTGDGRDRLLDYADGRDRIEIDRGARDFGDLDISQRGRHAVVDYGGKGDAIVVLDTRADELDARDFLFG